MPIVRLASTQAVMLRSSFPLSYDIKGTSVNAQAIAVVLSDGSLAAAECLEEDDWESAAEASEPSNMPQNVSEDTGCPALSMPLSQLLSAEEAAGLGLMHARWLSLTVAASLNQVYPDEPCQKSKYKKCCTSFALCLALCTGLLQGMPS